MTLIFLGLALSLSFIVGLLYNALKPASSALSIDPITADPVMTIIPIACGLLVAPVTLRLNRWIEWRMRW